jgi:hypothetical protein
MKILLSNIRDISNMKTEIRTRQIIAEYQTVNVPKIFEIGIDFSPPFFTEELIWGERPFKLKDSKIISDVLCPQMWESYIKYGIKEKQLKNILDPCGFYNELLEAVNKIPWRRRYGEKDIFLLNASALVRDDGFLQYSLGHGDLSLGNIIITDDKKIYLVDWEQAKERPVVFDLYRIITSFPQSKRYIKTQIESHKYSNGNIKFIPFENQILLAALLKVKKWCSAYPSTANAKIPGLEDRICTAVQSVINK